MLSPQEFAILAPRFHPLHYYIIAQATILNAAGVRTALAGGALAGGAVSSRGVTAPALSDFA